MVEKVSIMEEHWNYLIILDACRYDYFSKLYKGYLRGNLQKRISLGSSTLEWCQKSFHKHYKDVVFISANPYINSKVTISGFNAINHFHRVIDVWDWGWDDELGTVHPEEVNIAVQKVKDYYREKRFIIHYLQPHAPYLGCRLGTSGFPRPQINHGKFISGIMDGHPLSRLEKKLLKILVNFAKLTGCFGEQHSNYPMWKSLELLKLPPASPMDAVRRRFGNGGLRKAYRENLRIVLQHVARLVEDLSGVIIITADHGERLGEKRSYSHNLGLSDPLLLEVPWFEVEKVIETKTLYEDTERERIKQRIKKLKALNRL